MIPFALPPVYETVAITEEKNSDNFKFGTLTFFDTKENIILNTFILYGGIITDRLNTEKFLKQNPVIADNFNEIFCRLTKCFPSSDYSLEFTQMPDELPELFLIIKSKISPNLALNTLGEFDDWFVPNIFKKFTRFNVNIEYA